MPTSPVNSANFLRGGGAMGELTRAYNWDDSPVGNPEGWPQSLRTTVSTILLSKFPMFLWWGDELLQFYNDAYRPSLGNQGKHPQALGQRGEDCWPEVWPTIKPLIDRVLDGGESTWNENQLLPINRNGHMEDVYWTFSYSAVLTDSGKTGGVLVVCQETTQLILAQKNVQQSEARFRAIVEQAPLGIALLSGREMTIETANEPMYEIWRKDSSVIGLSLVEAQPELRGQRFIKLLEVVYDTGEPYFGHGELAQMERDGRLQEAYFNFAYTPLRDASGTTTGVMILAAEVTIQKKNELVLQQSLQREQDINQLKSQFVSTASHEFRTPLTTIQTSADLINMYLAKPQPIAKPAIEKHLGVISQQIKDVDELLTDLLTMGKIEAGKVAFHPRWVDTRVLCQQVIDSHFIHQIDGRVVQLLVEGVPHTTFLDEKLLGHALVNLLSNAFKYSRNDPRLVLHFTSETVMIQVIDTGIGIPASDLSSLFQTFFRASNSKGIQGTGLGLVIAQQFVELQGGTLTVQSEEGIGTTFTIILPNGAPELSEDIDTN
ncbi:PAS domain-containing sensor histidine kinase [Spirosoma flavum]|uniref:histidine kinase n=1 Tax=Spirosoma flavum TaxID=2048557 RepID=A0ABW6AQW9_9BACT